MRIATRTLLTGVALATLVASGQPASTREPAQGGSAEGRRLYDQIKAFPLTGGLAEVERLVLKRDRVEMTLTGVIHFAAPIDGRVTGAVFVGQGTMRAAPPPSDFEKDYVRRMLGADVVESDFRTAVLRWSDDTFEVIGKARVDAPGPAPAQAARLANDFEPRLLQESGPNLSARLAVSILNHEAPGVFFAEFDGGKRGRFSYVLDHQGRIPVAQFNLNAGEKGVIYQYQSTVYYKDVWMTFYSESDYAAKTVSYSDVHDQVDVTHYNLTLDVRGVPEMSLDAEIHATIKAPQVRALSFNLNESMSGVERRRLVHQLRVKSASVGGTDAAFVMEDWEGGFTIFLPEAAAAGAQLRLGVRAAGRGLQVHPLIGECYYLYSNSEWLPRHGYLDRSTFDMTFRHRSRERIAAVGVRAAEDVDPADRNVMVTRYRMDQPVALALFAVGPFERKAVDVTLPGSGRTIPVEFNSVPARVLANTNANAVNHAFLLDELNNAIRYFDAIFGRYPYGSFGATFHPFGFGQGFASMLVIPPVGSIAGERENAVYSFMAHETAHQWWGNVVAWRSYRDQWLSEGFAEYSGLSYAAKRDKDPVRTTQDLVREMRDSLRETPRTFTGAGRGRLNDIGPIIEGLRLNSSRTFGGYQTLVYQKGALVVRMLHFLFSHPSTYDDAAFFAMMKDFVERHRDGAATTEDFWRVASQHFARTPTAQKFGLRDLDWFFRQWVYGTGLPTYQLEWQMRDDADGSMFVTGTVRQENVGADWQMVLPLVLSFEGGQEARTTVRVEGQSSPFELKVPARPRRVDLDPHAWVLSERTTTRGR